MPHTDETFFKMKCGWTEDPKVEALGRFGPVDACLARYVFAEMIDYARRELTDGRVVGEALGRIGYPLTPDEAMRLAMLLADPGPSGPLCDWDAASNAFSILAYARWNDTRAEVQARKDKAEKAARTRWESAGARGNAGSNAGSRHRARAHVDAEQEQEQENPPHPPARNDAPGTPAEAEGEGDFYHQIVALLHNSGHTVTYAEAVTITERLVKGRAQRPRDPRAWVLGVVSKNPADAMRVLAATGPARKRNDPPPTRTLCRRCSRTDHRTEDCPTLEPGERAGGSDETARHGAELARKQLAEAQRVAGVRVALDEAAALHPEAGPPDADAAPADVDAGLPDW